MAPRGTRRSRRSTTLRPPKYLVRPWVTMTSSTRSPLLAQASRCSPRPVHLGHLLVHQPPHLVGRQPAGRGLAQRLADPLAHDPLALPPGPLRGLGRDLHPLAPPRRDHPHLL